MIGEDNKTMSNKWYICEMKSIILSCDGSEYYIIRVPDNIANDLAGFIDLFYKQRYNKMPLLEPFDPIEEFIDFVNCKVHIFIQKNCLKKSLPTFLLLHQHYCFQ